MKTIIGVTVLLSAVLLFQGCSEEPLTEAEIEDVVAGFLESRDYPSRDQVEITLEWYEEDEIWRAEVVPNAEHRGELTDWEWPVRVLVSPTGGVMSVY